LDNSGDEALPLDDLIISREIAEQAVDSHLVTAERDGIGYWALHIPPPISLEPTTIAGFCGATH
jgi:hypothetical protein